MLFLKKCLRENVTKYLTKVLKNAPAKMDSTEAYIRHRERVRERERINKLARYKKRHPNAHIVDDKIKKKESEPVPEEDENDKENLLELYNELKKIDEVNAIEPNKIKLEILEIPRQMERKKAPKSLEKKKAPKHKKKLKKPQSCLDIEDDDAEEVEEEIKFTPKMAGQTGLPIFFFSNLVKDSRSAFLNTIAKNKMNYKTFPPK